MSYRSRSPSKRANRAPRYQYQGHDIGDGSYPFTPREPAGHACKGQDRHDNRQTRRDDNSGIPFSTGYQYPQASQDSKPARHEDKRSVHSSSFPAAGATPSSQETSSSPPNDCRAVLSLREPRREQSPSDESESELVIDPLNPSGTRSRSRHHRRRPRRRRDRAPGFEYQHPIDDRSYITNEYHPSRDYYLDPTTSLGYGSGYSGGYGGVPGHNWQPRAHDPYLGNISYGSITSDIRDPAVSPGLSHRADSSRRHREERYIPTSQAPMASRTIQVPAGNGYTCPTTGLGVDCSGEVLEIDLPPTTLTGTKKKSKKRQRPAVLM